MIAERSFYVNILMERSTSPMPSMTAPFPGHRAPNFDTSAVDHPADEEIDLFPALIDSMAGSDATCIRALIESLKGDHRTLEWRPGC